MYRLLYLYRIFAPFLYASDLADFLIVFTERPRSGYAAATVTSSPRRWAVNFER